MSKQQKLAGLIILVFTVSVTAYSLWVYHSHQVNSVNYANQNDKFAQDGVPGFALPVLNPENGSATGEDLKLGNLEDKIVLINYWASWCAPCQTEFPSLLDLARHYESSAGTVKVLAISVDNNLQGLAQFLMAQKHPFPKNFIVLSDSEGNIANKYGTHKLPETYIINKDHKLLRKVIDQQAWASQGFLGFVDGLLGSQK